MDLVENYMRIKNGYFLSMCISSSFISLFLLLFSTSTNASVFGGSNLGYSGYPAHTCIKPTKPYKPFSFSNQWDVDSYNSQVEYYNTQLRRYLYCIDEYIKNANNDIERIREKAKEAINDASE